MNPIVKNNNLFTWKVNNIETLNEIGFLSLPYQTGQQMWTMHARTHTVNQIKYLSVYFNIASSGLNNSQSWICQVIYNKRLLGVGNPQMSSEPYRHISLYTPTDVSWGCACFLRWSDIQRYTQNKSITIQIEFDYKFYDFSKNQYILTDSIVKVRNVDFHVSGAYLSTFSKFFNERFLNGTGNTVTIDWLAPDSFATVLASLYPNPIIIDNRNYDILIDLSMSFGISSLTTKCERYFEQTIGKQLIQEVLEVEKVDKKHKQVMRRKSMRVLKIPKMRKYRNKTRPTKTITKKRKITKVGICQKSNKEKLMPGILVNLKRPREFKLIMQTEEFKKFEDSTKVHFLNTALRFIS